jgi:parvulin-like peptidyl-prolyl isomerase
LADTVNRIIAIVNDEVITEADVTSHVNALLEEGESPATVPQEPAAIHQAVLHRLIEERLILQEAKRGGISVRPDEILQRLNQLRARVRSEEEFQRLLRDWGLSQEELKERIRDQLMVQRVIEVQVRSGIVVSPQEVAQEIGAHPELAKSGDRARALHVVLRVTQGRSEAQTRALAEDIHRQLTEGADFSALAKRYSEGPSGEEGGVMGWVAQGELLPELDAALFSLSVGEFSNPIQTRLGFHLVKVEERRTASSLSLMEANRAVYQRIYQQRFEEGFKRWLDGLKRRAYIELVSPDKA